MRSPGCGFRRRDSEKSEIFDALGNHADHYGIQYQPARYEECGGSAQTSHKRARLRQWRPVKTDKVFLSLIFAITITITHHRLVDRRETGHYLMSELLFDTGSGRNITATVCLEWLRREPG